MERSGPRSGPASDWDPIYARYVRKVGEKLWECQACPVGARKTYGDKSSCQRHVRTHYRNGRRVARDDNGDVTGMEVDDAQQPDIGDMPAGSSGGMGELEESAGDEQPDADVGGASGAASDAEARHVGGLDWLDGAGQALPSDEEEDFVALFEDSLQLGDIPTGIHHLPPGRWPCMLFGAADSPATGLWTDEQSVKLPCLLPACHAD